MTEPVFDQAVWGKADHDQKTEIVKSFTDYRAMTSKGEVMKIRYFQELWKKLMELMKIMADY